MTSRVSPKSKKHLFSKLKAKKIDTVDAGWRVFNIIYKTGLKTANDPCFGKTDFDACEIYLDRGMEHGLARETLIHEVFHIMLEGCGLGGDEDDVEPLFVKNNESLTMLTSRAFLLLANLNSELFKILFCEDKNE